MAQRILGLVVVVCEKCVGVSRQCGYLSLYKINKCQTKNGWNGCPLLTKPDVQWRHWFAQQNVSSIP